VAMFLPAYWVSYNYLLCIYSAVVHSVEQFVAMFFVPDYSTAEWCNLLCLIYRIIGCWEISFFVLGA